MRKEIEVKARITSVPEVVRKLEELDCAFAPPVEQDDAIFVDGYYGDFAAFQPGKNLLRIRKSGDKILLTLKQPQKNEIDALEREVEINDAREAEEILQLMGYHLAARVRKVRRKTAYRGWEICVDEVESIGSFVEVECITEEDDGEAVQRELFDFLLSLGVREEDRVLHGYDTMVYLKQRGR